jgi:hypothetical protein
LVSLRLTCCLKDIFPFGVFLVKFDRKDSGKTKAALETRTKAKMVELKAIDFTGLHMIKKIQIQKKNLLLEQSRQRKSERACL